MKKVVRFFTNKFVVTTAIFAAWMLWFDQNDMGSQRERSRSLREAKDNIAYLEKEIARMEQEHHQLTTNPGKLEKFAREQYKMKRDNEDIYVIEQK
ncbi:MAG: septum formation initiator family protein [Flavipsychrobacter sp.]|nr:septum formation initiator family protein [Flavipsychrobacter sp.]